MRSKGFSYAATSKLAYKRKVKNARIRAVLNAKHALGHASMSGGVLLHFNAALQQFF